MSLIADKITLGKDGKLRSLPVAAGKYIYAGALVVNSATGFAEPGLTAANVTAVGRAEQYADNTLGADGAINVQVRRGIFAFANSTGADAISRANIGQTCYVVDDETVALTGAPSSGTNTRSAAGRVFDVDADGVWVEIL
jgi:hypothetical protein